MTEPVNASGYPLSDDLRETMASALGMDVDEGWLLIATELLEQITAGPRATAPIDKITKLDRPLPCLICGKELEPAYTSRDPEIDFYGNKQPYGAVVCSTSGNYGSMVWDSLRGDERLEFNICDECIKYCAPGRVLEVHYRRQPSKIEIQRFWDPTTEGVGTDDDDE